MTRPLTFLQLMAQERVNKAQQLSDMQITRVSAVDRGANGKRFAIFKRADGETAGLTPQELTAAIAKACAPLVARIEALEPVRRRTAAGDVAGVKKSMWAGIL